MEGAVREAGPAVGAEEASGVSAVEVAAEAEQAEVGERGIYVMRTKINSKTPANFGGIFL